MDQFTLLKESAGQNGRMAQVLALGAREALQMSPELARRAVVYVCAMTLIAASPALLGAQKAAMCMAAHGGALALGV